MVKKFFNIIFLSIILFVTYVATSYAGTGATTVYKVTMRKVEFCTNSTGVTDCKNAVIIGSGDKVVDIAAVDAGAGL